MRGNKGKDTKPELLVRRLLRQAGYPGYRLHWKKAPGRPDIAYPGRKVAIFVNGCYWHRCPTCHPPAPKANAEFWEAKFVANEERDARQMAELASEGWTVITVWECELREAPEQAVATIVAVLG
jgi:DNA mismatch endonuclease Vsr